MKKYSSEARELLSNMEQYEVKAGGENGGVTPPNLCVTICATCVSCVTSCAVCAKCVTCTTKAFVN